MRYIRLWGAFLLVSLIGTLSSAANSPKDSVKADAQSDIQKRLLSAAEQVAQDTDRKPKSRFDRFAQWFNWNNWDNWDNWSNW